MISSLSFGYVDLKILSKIKRLVLYSLNDYRKSSINPPGGLFISSPFEGGLNRDGGLIGEGGGGGGGLLNLEKTMVLFVHKELEYKVENLKTSTRRFEVIQPRIRIKCSW